MNNKLRIALSIFLTFIALISIMNACVSAFIRFWAKSEDYNYFNGHVENYSAFLSSFQMLIAVLAICIKAIFLIKNDKIKRLNFIVLSMALICYPAFWFNLTGIVIFLFCMLVILRSKN